MELATAGRWLEICSVRCSKGYLKDSWAADIIKEINKRYPHPKSFGSWGPKCRSVRRIAGDNRLSLEDCGCRLNQTAYLTRGLFLYTGGLLFCLLYLFAVSASLFGDAVERYLLAY